MGSLLTREQVLDRDDLGSEVVEVPEWHGSVRLRGLAVDEWDDLEPGILQDGKVNGRNLRAKILARAVIDDSGARIFSDEDVPRLGRKSAAVMSRLFNVVSRLSGMTDEAAEKILGNSAGGRAGGSSFGSPPSSG